MSIDDTLKERGNSYGEFTTQGMWTQRLKEIFRHEDTSWESMDDDMKEALDMIASKIARLLNGDPSHTDSWHDIQGYARLVEKRLIDDEEAYWDAVEEASREAEEVSREFQKQFNVNEAINNDLEDWMTRPMTASEMGIVNPSQPVPSTGPDFHGIHINGHEEIQGREYDEELPATQDHPDAVLPGFANEPNVGMEAAHGAMPKEDDPWNGIVLKHYEWPPSKL